MSNTRNLADLLDSSGDVKSAALDNVPATDISGKLNTSGGTLTGTLIMESTDAGNSAEPELILYRNSPSPSSGDYLGQIQFKGENANGGQEIYAKVTGKISDPTHSSEDGLIETAIKGDGSFTIVSRQKADELQLINGVNLDVAGNITVGGTVDGVDIQTLNTTAGAALPKAGGTMTGNIAHAGDFTIDVGGDLILDADGGDFLFRDGGTDKVTVKVNDNSNVDFISKTADHDIRFRGNDGGSTITALTLDMSDSGLARFNRGICFNNEASSENELDDYEEGTHAYTITGASGGSMTPRSGYNHFAYTKVGRLVTVQGRFETSGSHTASGQLRVSLPFSSHNGLSHSAQGAGVVSIYRAGDNFNNLRAVVFNNSNYFVFYYNEGGTGDSDATVAGADVDATIEGSLSITYMT